MGLKTASTAHTFTNIMWYGRFFQMNRLLRGVMCRHLTTNASFQSNIKLRVSSALSSVLALALKISCGLCCVLYSGTC